MCISFLFINDPDDPLCSKYKLILINNRDEYFTRETQNSSIINQDKKKSIYGIDLAGCVQGTWLGISKDESNRIKLGNLANVTGGQETVNSSPQKSTSTRGRGPIVCDWINNEISIEQHAQYLYDTCQDYSNFNFISTFIDGTSKAAAYYVSNAPKSIKKLPYGCVGMGNSPLIMPFKKVIYGTELFEEIVRISDNLSRDDMIESFNLLLKSRNKYFPDEELIERKKDENVDPERFSSINIELKDLGYGTRTHTIILVDKDNNIDYIEETMATTDPGGEWVTTNLRLSDLT